MGGKGARPAAGRVIHEQLEGVDLRLHVAGMPVVVPVVLGSKAAGKDLDEGSPRPHEEGVYQPRPMHANLPDIPRQRSYKEKIAHDRTFIRCWCKHQQG